MKARRKERRKREKEGKEGRVEGGREGVREKHWLPLGVCWHGNMIYLLNKDSGSTAILLCISPTEYPQAGVTKHYQKDTS